MSTAPVALIPSLTKTTAREPATELKVSGGVRVSDEAAMWEEASVWALDQAQILSF